MEPIVTHGWRQSGKSQTEDAARDARIDAMTVAEVRELYYRYMTTDPRHADKLVCGVLYRIRGKSTAKLRRQG